MAISFVCLSLPSLAIIEIECTARQFAWWSHDLISWALNDGWQPGANLWLASLTLSIAWQCHWLKSNTEEIQIQIYTQIQIHIQIQVASSHVLICGLPPSHSALPSSVIGWNLLWNKYKK